MNRNVIFPLTHVVSSMGRVAKGKLARIQCLLKDAVVSFNTNQPFPLSEIITYPGLAKSCQCCVSHQLPIWTEPFKLLQQAFLQLSYLVSIRD